jgi:hypothetical protein
MMRMVDASPNPTASVASRWRWERCSAVSGDVGDRVNV